MAIFLAKMIWKKSMKCLFTIVNANKWNRCNCGVCLSVLMSGSHLVSRLCNSFWRFFHRFFIIFFTIPFSKPFNRAPYVLFMYMRILYKHRAACEPKWVAFSVWKWAKNSVKLLWSRYLAPRHIWIPCAMYFQMICYTAY